MHILVAPDKFKGSMSALAAAEAIARGWHSARPADAVTLAPIADGGEGFAEALCGALHGEWVVTEAADPLGRRVSARFAWVAARQLAIIDMSEASGLWRLRPEERAPLAASTYGTGELMRAAAARGAETILLGLGGSATTDGGIGMAAALGFRFVGPAGDLAPIPANLSQLSRIIRSEMIALPQIIAACDVQNPLLGSRGTARVFAPQKGATPAEVELLEQLLTRLAACVTTDLGVDFRATPGAGAAGGIGYGLLSFCGAKMRAGFEVVAEILGLAGRVAAADLVITGEGRLDDQTLDGKGPAGLAALARAHGRPVLAFGGSIARDARLEEVFAATCPIVDEPTTLEQAMQRGPDFLERAAARAARLLHLVPARPGLSHLEP